MVDSPTKRFIWLDCDPGHDDAAAILLALHCTNITLLGISTVHGNTSLANTEMNAAKCLEAFGAPEDIKVYRGAPKPLIRPVRHDPQIHGISGLAGVENLPDAGDPKVLRRFQHPEGPTKAIEAIANAVRKTWRNGEGQQVVILSSGPMTNIALFVSVYPELLTGVEEFVFMGGGVGVGNRSAAAGEFNILCDPEAAQIVLDAPVKKTMIPLNVTHTAIVSRSVHGQLLSPSKSTSTTGDPTNLELPPASTPLRYMLSTMITHFAEAYKSTFGFNLGPPLHDALTVGYVSAPELFQCKRYRVDVELSGTHTAGETVVDLWNYRACDETWGSTGKNCLVAESLDIAEFFNLFLGCIARCDLVSPLNSK